jgi:hypothetical protein
MRTFPMVGAAVASKKFERCTAALAQARFKATFAQWLSLRFGFGVAPLFGGGRHHHYDGAAGTSLGYMAHFAGSGDLRNQAHDVGMRRRLATLTCHEANCTPMQDWPKRCRRTRVQLPGPASVLSRAKPQKSQAGL